VTDWTVKVKTPEEAREWGLTFGRSAGEKMREEVDKHIDEENVDAPECPLAELFPDAPQPVKVTTKMARQAGFCRRRVEVTTRLAIHG
jgi:hypothetical protein